APAGAVVAAVARGHPLVIALKNTPLAELLTFARARCLNWWTWRQAEGTEHAAVARLRPQLRAATAAFVKYLTGIGWHGFHLGHPAMRTDDQGFEDHVTLFDCHGAKLHPVATTGSRSRFHARDHGFASAKTANRRTVTASRCEHRDHSLLRAGQDTTRAA